MWYDLNICHEKWEDILNKFQKCANNKKYTNCYRIKFCGLQVADFIEQKVVVTLSQAWEIYSSSCKEDYKHVKDISPNYLFRSSDARHFFLRNMPLIVVYKPSKNGPQANLTKRLEGVAWTDMIGKLEWPTLDKLLKDETLNRVQSFIEPALGYASTARDRNLLKCMLTMITGASALSKKCGFHKGTLHKIFKQSQCQVNMWEDIKMSSNSSYDAKKRKIEEIQIRQPGSGRPYIADKYPELATCMLSLFDSCDSGLQSHPRLICETLFLQKKTWLDMPRAVSILNQTFGIPIALSTAYTYTQNFISKSKQAERHHEGKSINPDISLNRATRDAVQKTASINHHFAMADLQYSLRSMENECIIARDDKALVHTDVEVVQRPSTSWVRVQYADHDWEKDSKRTLSITTYQFVHVAKIDEEEHLQSIIGSVGVSKTRLRGNGASLVKVHFYESSTAFRHMNELLFIMSLDEYQHHFLSNDSKFVSQILVTVDGGGDERPRNKITQLCCSILRLLLNLDKFKCQSLAEGSSKYHSVERLHTAENRALSQQGTISSKNAHSDETDLGIWNTEKFRDNMNFAREEAINRLQDVPYAKDTINGHAPPPTADWVIGEEYVAMINKFLERDDLMYHQENNFLIKPRGPIWDKLCNLYDLQRNIVKLAFHIHRYMIELSTFCHYSFAAYRPNEEWRHKPLKHYQIQPLIDMSRLPEFHYLPYEEAVKIVDNMTVQDGVPEFVTIPDFFLPSRNIQHILKHSPEEFRSSINTISQLVGVSPDDIRTYVDKLHHKEMVKLERKKVVDSFNDSPLSHLNMAELKYLLCDHFRQKYHSSLKVEADFLITISKIMEERQVSAKSLAATVKRLFDK